MFTSLVILILAFCSLHLASTQTLTIEKRLFLTSPCLQPNAPIYVGCKKAFGSADVFWKQCGNVTSNPNPKIYNLVVDGIPNDKKDPCLLPANSNFFLGCGNAYANSTQRIRQCGKYEGFATWVPEGSGDIPISADGVPCLLRSDPVYTGCGEAYGRADVFWRQCGAPTNANPVVYKFIGDGIPGLSPCKLSKGSPIYIGCGNAYASETERTKQCGKKGPTLKWNGDGMPRF